VKASKEIKTGDVISIHRNTAVFSYKVIQLLDRRVGAKLVNEYILDMTSDEEREKYKNYQSAQSTYRENGTGKPTKKDRRNIDDFLEGW
jgi:ribosome-associated heat shock protein Hsp15